MKKIWGCRRTSLAFFAISCLTGIGLYLGQDVSGIAVAIAGIVASVAGSNAFENSKQKQPKQDDGY